MRKHCRAKRAAKREPKNKGTQPDASHSFELYALSSPSSLLKAPFSLAGAGEPITTTGRLGNELTGFSMLVGCSPYLCRKQFRITRCYLKEKKARLVKRGAASARV